MSFKDLLGNRIIILDGAMGTMLQHRGLAAGQCPEIMNVQHPDVVTEVQRSYITAGSAAIYSNTFGANKHKLQHAGLNVEEVVNGAISAARSAAENTNVFVGLDLGPIGELVEPMGSLTFDEAYELYKQQVIQGEKDGADFIVIESFADLYEVKAALLAAKENSTLPVMVTMTFEENMRTYTGCHITCMGATLESLGADAIGINCSLGPVQIKPIAKALADSTNLPLVAKPNAGLPIYKDGVSVYDISPSEFAKTLVEYVEFGYSLLGGCCGTSPEYIKLLKDGVSSKMPVSRNNCDLSDFVCAASKGVNICKDTPIAAVSTQGKDLDDLIDEVMDAIDDGNLAIKLELNCDDNVTELIKGLQASANIPLIFCCSNAAALSAALRCYNGRPGVFSSCLTNSDLIAAVEKYGASIIR